MKKVLLTLFCCFGLGLGLAAQTIHRVTGRVIDRNGHPIVGAMVLVEGTNTADITDPDGYFDLHCPTPDETLHFMFLGHTTRMIPVEGRSTIDCRLEEEAFSIDDVVVVGHGTQRRANLTGAVSSVSGAAFENRPMPNLTRGLQGLIPGLNIAMSNGAPTASATYNVRGQTASVGFGGSALVLIDDVEGDPNMLNPNDIESVSVLKDASSAAIYGARAAFGVVLITTKTPVRDRVRVNFNSSFSNNQRIVTPNVVTDGLEWVTNFNEAFLGWYDYINAPTSVNTELIPPNYLEMFKNRDPSAPTAEYDPSFGRYVYYGNTDWDKVLHKKNIFSTEQSLSVSGGSELVNYYVSGRYYHQDGIFNSDPDKFDTYNIRAKGSIAMTDWLDLSENFEYSSSAYKYPLTIANNVTPWRYIQATAFPFIPVQNPDGTYTQAAATLGLGDDYNNYSLQNSSLMRTTTTLTAHVADGLRLKGDITYTRSSPLQTQVQNYIDYSNTPETISRVGSSMLRQWVSNTYYYASNITADYNKTFGERHDLGALVGYNIESSSTRNFYMQRDGFIIPSKPDFGLMDGINYNITGGGSEWTFAGLFYRLNYAYDERYLLELNGRYDGSSKFPEDQRYGFFPSVSVGWRLSEEAFMDGTDGWLDNLKLRASYGTLGNGNVAPYRFMETMNIGKMSPILDGYQPTYTQMPGVLPDGLTWESSTTFDVGIDLLALQQRLSLSFDWYDRQTRDMFTVGPPLPGVFGAAAPSGNYADLSTKGWELSLSWIDDFQLGGSPFQYMVSGSLWDSRSKITQFNNPNNLLSTYYVGQELGEIWGYETAGFFASDEEADTWADQSFLQNSNGRIYLAGDLKFNDLNGDGAINQGSNTLEDPGDRRVIGNSAPRYQFGFNVGGSWKGFSLMAFFQGIAKRDWYFNTESGLFWGPYSRPYGDQPHKVMDNIWTPENPDAYFPRFRGYNVLGTTRSLGAPQTRYLQDASYIRLKTLTLEYTLPNKILDRIGIDNLRIFLTGQNLFTRSGLFRHTDNFDPEVIENPEGNFLSSNGQGYAYPMLKTYTAGINLSF